MNGLVPATRGPLERYEVREVETNDVLVMWRVPFVLRQSDHAVPSITACIRAEACRIAVAKVLRLRYTRDLSESQETDALKAGDKSIQVIPVSTADQYVHCQDFDCFADFAVFVEPQDERTVTLGGWLARQ